MSIALIKQISDKEKIEIMQHHLDGAEIECKVFHGTEWSVVQPSWAWNDCFYRKRIYDYPLYFEFTNVCDSDSEKFIVEFTGLTEGTIVQKTDSDWEIGHFDNEWIPHTDKDFWKEVDKPKELDERIKKPGTQIVYECYRTDKKTGESEIISKLLTDKMLKILENENRTQYTYHKTGRSFEIKLGDK